MNALLEELRAAIPAGLFNQLSQLPPSLKLEKLTYYRAASKVVEQKRSAFDTLKGAFLQHVAVHCADQLRAMNMTDQSIEAMRVYGMFPSNVPGERMDMTIDHVRSLKLGGANEFDNLILLPDALNVMKDTLEQHQLSDASHGTLITIVPARMQDMVPFIPGGFRRASAKTRRAPAYESTH